MKLRFRFQIYWAKESLCIHPFREGTWQLLQWWQLHRDEVRILMLMYPHTDLKTLVNGTVLLILKQVVAVLSVYIFVCHFTTWLAALRTSLSILTLHWSSLLSCIYTNTPKVIATQKRFWISQEFWARSLHCLRADLIDTGLLAHFQANLSHTMGTLRAWVWAFDLDPSGSEILGRRMRSDLTVFCYLNKGLQVRLHLKTSFYH